MSKDQSTMTRVVVNGCVRIQSTDRVWAFYPMLGSFLVLTDTKDGQKILRCGLAQLAIRFKSKRETGRRNSVLSRQKEVL